MKTITMDYDQYLEEISENEHANKCMGVSDVMRFLESDLTLEKFLLENNWVGQGANLLAPHFSDWMWVRIAKIANRKIT